MRLLLILILSGISFFSFSQKKKNKKLTLEEQVALAKKQEQEAKQLSRKPLATEGAKMPSFNVLTSNQTLFFDTSIAPNKPAIITLFNPGCDHCMMVAKDFYQNIDKLKDVTMLFVTGNNLWGELQEFIRIAGLDLNKAKNIIISADNSNLTKDIFEYNGIPQVMIYNKDKILQKVFFQNISMDSVSYYLNKP